MNPCFLDTSAVLDLIRNRPAARMATEPYEEQFLPFIVLGELVSGAYQTRDPEAELTRFEEFIRPMPVFDGDRETAYLFGKLLADLERRGCRIPMNDIWIAAVALQHDLPLVARDEHFGRVSGLRWVGY